MKHFYTILILGLMSVSTLNAQCTVDVYGEYITITPVCGNNNWNGLVDGWLGEYSIVNVIQGNTYEFQTYRNNGAQTSRFATITTTSNQIIAFGTTNPTTSVTWIATFTGQIRFWSHTNSGCGTGAQNTVRRVRCTEPPCAAPSEAGVLVADKLETVDNDAVSWEVTGGDPIIRYEYNFNGGAWTELLTATPTLDLVIFANGGFFELRSVHQFNNCPISYSNVVTTSFNCAPYFEYGPTDGDFITNVSLNTLNNTSTSDFGDALSPLELDAFQNFDLLSTDLIIGQDYELSVSGTTTFGASQGFGAWIDWNNDGSFDASENVLISGPTQSTNTSLNVPTTAITGLVKMRVLCAWNTTPTADACAAINYNYGEIEEYTINILEASALPVQLTSFQANCEDAGYNSVTWQTESETNSSHFIVERSRDGDVWLTGSSFPAAGTSGELKNYTYNDMAAGANFEGYYRLKQIDFDGEEEVFGPISINCDNVKDDYIEIYPNPSSGNFIARVYSNIASDNAVIKVCNANGNIVHQQITSLDKGVTTLFFEQNQLERGMYFIQLEADNLKIAPQKLIIH